MAGHRATRLPDGRLHLQEGPIDLVIAAFGEAGEVEAAYGAAEASFAGVLAGLVEELPLLRTPIPAQYPDPPPGASLLEPLPPLAVGRVRVGGRSELSRPFHQAARPPIPDPSPPQAGGRGHGAVVSDSGLAAKARVPPPAGPIARRMHAACRPYRDRFITPMAAVAGAVADHVLAGMRAAVPALRRAYVNNGGDIALHLAQGEHLDIGVVRSLAAARPEGFLRIDHGQSSRGVATSGRHGRSFSLGIADAVTVLARDAAAADAAATMIANAVDCDDAAIVRRPAQSLDPDSDLGDLPVTVAVGPLPAGLVCLALERGAALAEEFRAAGLIDAALLSLAGEWRGVGPLPQLSPPRSR